MVVLIQGENVYDVLQGQQTDFIKDHTVNGLGFGGLGGLSQLLGSATVPKLQP